MGQRFAVLFSGGIDSSYCACFLAEQGYDIDLIHCNQGSLISEGLYKLRASEIQSRYSHLSIRLIEMNTFGAFRRIALADLEADFKKYQKSMICLGCRLSMHIEVINYCLKNGIAFVADGAIHIESDYPEQREVAVSFFKELYGSSGITYQNPIYNLTKKEIKYRLLDSSVTIQSMEDTCLFSHTFSEASDESILKYLKEKRDTFFLGVDL